MSIEPKITGRIEADLDGNVLSWQLLYDWDTDEAEGLPAMGRDTLDVGPGSLFEHASAAQRLNFMRSRYDSWVTGVRASQFPAPVTPDEALVAARDALVAQQDVLAAAIASVEAAQLSQVEEQV